MLDGPDLWEAPQGKFYKDAGSDLVTAVEESDSSYCPGEVAAPPVHLLYLRPRLEANRMFVLFLCKLGHRNAY